MRRCLGVLVLALVLTACGSGRSAGPPLSPARVSDRSPAPTQWVGTHGIEVAVPAAWRLGRGMCGTPKENTVLWNEGAVLACLTFQPPGLSVVEFGGVLRRPHGWYRRHTTLVAIGGALARRRDVGIVRGSHEVELDFPRRHISVTVLSPDRSLLRRILASVRTVRIDAAGCPTRPASAYRRGSRPRASGPFVPKGAVAVIGCSYKGLWLDRSNRSGRAAAARLAQALDAAPFGFSRAPGHILPSACGSTWRGSSIVARFEYGGGRSISVTAHLIGCTRLGASNGRWGVKPRPWWVGLLTTDARYSGALIDPHTLR